MPSCGRFQSVTSQILSKHIRDRYNALYQILRRIVPNSTNAIAQCLQIVVMQVKLVIVLADVLQHAAQFIMLTAAHGCGRSATSTIIDI